MAGLSSGAAETTPAATEAAASAEGTFKEAESDDEYAEFEKQHAPGCFAKQSIRRGTGPSAPWLLMRTFDS